MLSDASRPCNFEEDLMKIDNNSDMLHAFRFYLQPPCTHNVHWFRGDGTFVYLKCLAPIDDDKKEPE